MYRPIHHVLYSRRTWQSQDHTRGLRNEKWLHIPLDDDNHAAVHQAVAIVPLPDHFMAGLVRRDFEPVPGNYGATIDNLLSAFDHASKDRHTGEIERDLGQLIIRAIELQKPFLELA